MQREVEYEFSAGARWVHWIRAFTIFALTVTGFYLSYVFIAPEHSDKPVIFLNAKFRMWHEIFGFILISITVFKVYLFFLDKRSLKERVSILDFINPIIWYKQIKYYLFLGEHPKLKGAYNPLQFIAYVCIYLLVILVSLTGLILYVHVYHNGLGGFLYEYMREIEVMMGGLANVREIHHLCMWGFLLFVPMHIYMAIFSSIKNKEGAIDSIVSGYKFSKSNQKA